MVGNILLLILKGVVGFLSNSQSMIADSLNSFGDVFSSVMTYIGNKISSKAADDDHNLGHGKAEYVYSFLISIIMILTAFSVLKSSVQTYIKKETVDFSYLLVVVSLITIVTKFSLYIYTKAIYKKYNNILIEANSKDHRNDCFITTLTLLSAIFGLHGYNLVDIIVAVFISIWIGYTAIKLFKESYDILMDKCMDSKAKERVYEIINRHKEVLRVNHFNSTPVGYRYQISFTIFVDGNLTTFASHEIANNLEREIEKEIEEVYLTVIHVNPLEVKDKKEDE